MWDGSLCNTDLFIFDIRVLFTLTCLNVKTEFKLKIFQTKHTQKSDNVK